MDWAAALYPGPDAAFFSPFHSPATVDRRVVRMNGVVTFIMAFFAGGLRGRNGTQWLVRYSTKVQSMSRMYCNSAAQQVL